MIETIEVMKRDGIGSIKSRKLRLQGLIPAILYGHGEENIPLMVRIEKVNSLINHGTKLVNLVGEVTDTALLRSVQWSSLGSDILHLDFARVSQAELVEVTLPVHLNGEAPGINEGGQLRFVSHEMTIRCPAGSIPEFIAVSVSELHLGQSIHAGEVKLPEGASTVTPAAIVIVHVVAPSGTTDESGATSGAEPELIRKEKPEAGAKA
jgi:large subunit ribosomal protein L25